MSIYADNTFRFVDKGPDLHKSISSSGHFLEFHHIEGEAVPRFYVSDQLAVQAIIDAYSLAQTQQACCDVIDRFAEDIKTKFLNAVQPAVSDASKAAWPIKAVEAQKYTTSGNPIDCPTLVAEASARQVPLADIVQRVMSHLTAWMLMDATITGVAGYHKDQVRAMTTFESALAYPFKDSRWPNF